ncbi:ras and Rab interactor 1-like [Corvus hawaiiensis]|uniref:ras and Rab interactor 1-like n=1 Tax=Corvus hawaiiensis TaxID=134902 RepID=UPI0020193806|nr:ras and Rab interactor 1-like [Corvus hawaiiensis]
MRAVQVSGMAAFPPVHRLSWCQGRPYGADDFLPVLIHVLAQRDELETEIKYMTELLDPSLLCGEGPRGGFGSPRSPTLPIFPARAVRRRGAASRGCVGASSWLECFE